jgi:fatty acid/phospholipid biosynthesis enzyme
MVGGAPDPRVLAAVVDVLSGDDRIRVHLVGELDALRRDASALCKHAQVVLHDAPGTVAQGEDPAVVRGRPNLPIRVALDLLVAQEVSAVRTAAPAGLALTAATFRLPKRRAVRGDDPVANERARLIAAARPALLVRVRTADGVLSIVDAGACEAATAVDIAGRLLATAEPGDRLGVLDPLGQRSSSATEVLDLLHLAGAQARALTATEALRGAVDVLGCSGSAGAIMLQTMSHLGTQSDGVATITGLDADVGVLWPSGLDSLSLSPRVAVA